MHSRIRLWSAFLLCITIYSGLWTHNAELCIMFHCTSDPGFQITFDMDHDRGCSWSIALGSSFIRLLFESRSFSASIPLPYSAYFTEQPYGRVKAEVTGLPAMDALRASET
jgi:hypothetical protein